MATSFEKRNAHMQKLAEIARETGTIAESLRVQNLRDDRAGQQHLGPAYTAQIGGALEEAKRREDERKLLADDKGKRAQDSIAAKAQAEAQAQAQFEAGRTAFEREESAIFRGQPSFKKQY